MAAGQDQSEFVIGRQVVNEMKIFIQYTIVLVVIVIASVISYQAGFEKAFQLGFEEALDEVVPAFPEITSISGQIKKIEGNVLTIDALPPIRRVAPGNEPFKTELFKVRVTDKTSITQAQVQTTAQQTTPAEEELIDSNFVVEEKVISLSDLRVGDTVGVEADQDITNKKEFEVSKVQKFILLTP